MDDDDILEINEDGCFDIPSPPPLPKVPLIFPFAQGAYDIVSLTNLSTIYHGHRGS